MTQASDISFRPLCIYGLPTAGKRPLAALLDDGNYIISDISLMSHDSFASIFPLYRLYLTDASTITENRAFDYDKRNFFIRKLLIDYSNYYFAIQSVIQNMYFYFNISSSKYLKINLRPKFSFYDLDNRVMKIINETDTTDPQVLYDIFCRNIYDCFDTKITTQCKYSISLANNELTNMIDCVNAYDAKIIYVDRNIYDAIGSSFYREALMTQSDFTSVLQRMQSRATIEWIKKIIQCRSAAHSLQNEMPNNVIVVEFNDILLRTKETMRSICKFIEIDFSDIFCIPSFRGMRCAGNDFFVIQDDMLKCLSKGEYSLLCEFIDKTIEKFM